jgi:uncharacterized protein with von Willebrand factor type A (vWA) domain
VSETEPSAPAHAPLPFADLLAVLRGRGMALGVREHLAVGRLLARFDDLDLETLRAALAALLARDPGEVELVRETFDQLYTVLPEDLEPPSPPPDRRERLAQTWSLLRRMGRLRWASWLATAVLALALTGFTGSWIWHRLHPPEHQRMRNVPPTETLRPDRPAPPVSDTYSVHNRNRALAASAGVATLAFLWLYRVRTRRLARRRASLLWSNELDAQPGPQTYDFVIRDLPLPFAAEVLDDMATLLGRQRAEISRGRNLDVDRTLDHTLRAGLAPHVVLCTHAAALPLLVLEDVADGMRPWQRRVMALLAGLEARGVPLDHWRFNADAGRLFRSVGGSTLSLRQLSRLHAERPLLVISTGQGALEGDDFAVAPWVEILRGWRHHAWLHPATDPRTWSAALRKAQLKVWPMTPAGLLAAAQQVVRGDPGPGDARTSPERLPTQLDVDRLRWLLTLAPRRDPELAELLRWRFCPYVPEAALIEALAAPPLDQPLGVGPTAAEVHQLLLEVLDDSCPQPGSVAHERWRLDRAMQQVHLAPEKAVAELAELAAGPLGGEVERALRPLPRETSRRLESKVLRPLRRRATREGFLSALAESGSGRRWTWPTAGEIAATLAAAALVIWGAGGWFLKVLNDEAPVRLEIAFQLNLIDPDGRGPFQLDVVQTRFPELSGKLAPTLYQDDQSLALVQKTLQLRAEDRGHWYQVRGRVDPTTLAISLPLWVEPAKPPLPRACSSGGLIPWVAFDRAKAEALSAGGRLVFVDVAADWSFTSKATERLVLGTPEVAKAFKENGVVPMCADWTNKSKEIAAFLEEHGRYGIPFYMLYRPGRKPYVFSEELDRDDLVATVREAAAVLRRTGEPKPKLTL